MAHDFKKFPELRNSQMEIYYFESPHKQIFEDFMAEVVKVTDGDTIRVRADFRDFDFPIRFSGTNAKELNEGGERAKEWLINLIEGEEVKILINPKNRVGKWGRLLGEVFFLGRNVNDESINQGFATPFEERGDGEIPDINKSLRVGKWF